MGSIYMQSAELRYSSVSFLTNVSQDKVSSTAFKDFLSSNDDKQVKTDEVKQTTSNETINQTNSTTQTNINKIKYSSTAYGYSVDSKGFMGVDFNKAAGLPENFKIHKSTLEKIEEYSNTYYVSKPSFKDKAFENIDMADTIKQYYKLFENVVGKSDKQVYTDEDLGKLPKGFIYDSTRNKTRDTYLPTDGVFLSDVGKRRVLDVYNNKKQIEEARNLQHDLSLHNVSAYNARFTKFSSKDFEKESSFNPNMSVYKQDGRYTRSGVFVGFLKSIGPMASDSGNTKLTQETKLSSIRAAQETNKWAKSTNISIDLQEASSNYDALLAYIKTQSQTLSNELLNGKTPNEDANDLMERFKKIASATSV